MTSLQDYEATRKAKALPGIPYPTGFEKHCKPSPVHNQMGLQIIICNTYRMQIYNGWEASQLHPKTEKQWCNGWA